MMSTRWTSDLSRMMETTTSAPALTFGRRTGAYATCEEANSAAVNKSVSTNLGKKSENMKAIQ